MKKLMAKIVLLSLTVTLLLSALSSALLTAAAASDSWLSISGAIVNEIVEPGTSYSYTTTIESSTAAPPMDIRVDACGFGSDLDGAWRYVNQSNDGSPYSALSYIKGLSPTSFHLEPGGSREVTWNMSIPAGISDGARYAMLHIYTLPLGEGEMGYVLAAEIPIILTISGSNKSMTGEITDLTTAGNVSAGEPIQVSTILRNTGNYYYKARNEVSLRDEQGNPAANAYTLLSEVEIIPTYSREFMGSLVPLNQKDGLPPGNYSLTSKAMLPDGTVLDTKTISFELGETYKYPTDNGTSSLCSRMDESSSSTRVFTNEVPSCIDSLDKAGLKVCFSGTGTVSGKVIAGKYADVPPVPVFFYAPQREGGTGNMPIRFVLVRVDGFDSGNALVTVSYTNAEVRDFNEKSLMLAYWDGTKWRSLSSIEIDLSAHTVTGSMPVSALSGRCTRMG